MTFSTTIVDAVNVAESGGGVSRWCWWFSMVVVFLTFGGGGVGCWW